MKAMLAGFIAIVLIAIGANQLLTQAGFSAQETQSGPAVRLDAQK